MPIFHAMKRLVASGRDGRIVNVEHSENVSFEHPAHTFARGVFNNAAVAPLIFAKSWHDMDWRQYLIGTILVHRANGDCEVIVTPATMDGTHGGGITRSWRTLCRRF